MLLSNDLYFIFYLLLYMSGTIAYVPLKKLNRNAEGSNSEWEYFFPQDLEETPVHLKDQNQDGAWCWF